MEEEKKLYPFKLIPFDETPAETIHVADLGFPDSQIRNGWLATNTLSEVMDMYMDRVVGENVFAYYGRQFPILIKRLHCKERTPLLAHPDDEIAGQRFDFLGKAKLWYVTGAEPGARLYLGFKRDVTAEEFYMACRHGDVADLLNVIEPSAGDSFYIKPGTVHAAGEGLEIAEVAESSPLDFRIFNWGRRQELDPFDEELNLEAAFDFIEYKQYAGPLPSQKRTVNVNPRILTENPEFAVNEIRLADSLHVSRDPSDSFSAYLCLSGEAAVLTPSDGDDAIDGQDAIGLHQEEALIVPAEVEDYEIVPRSEGTVLLEVNVKVAERPDTYTNLEVYPSSEDISDDQEEDWNDYGSGVPGMDLMN